MKYRLSVFSLALSLFLSPLAAAQSPQATIDIDTHHSVRLNRAYSGANTDVGFPVEYWDSRFNTLAAKADYAWIRFPGGTTGLMYDWHTGQERLDWLAEFAGADVGPTADEVYLVAGRGGAQLLDAARRAEYLGVTFVVCANALTDTPKSIGELAAFIKRHHIRVAAWELANEAYLYKSIFFVNPLTGKGDAGLYLDAMKPFRDAIKRVDPDAIVSVFASDPNHEDASWDAEIALYPDRYWDAISFHSYPAQSTGGFDTWVANECGALATRSSTLLTDPASLLGSLSDRFIISEFNASNDIDHKTGATSITDGTLWGGIFADEYMMRMSATGKVLNVGQNAAENHSGVDCVNTNRKLVIAIGKEVIAGTGTPIDTTTLDFGFFLSAQAVATSVLNEVVSHSRRVDFTTVTGGDSVAATGTPDGTMPALYATAYGGDDDDDDLSLVITNKSKNPQRVQIRLNGRKVDGRFALRFVTASSADVSNSFANPTAVSVQARDAQGVIEIPPFSVVSITGHDRP